MLSAMEAATQITTHHNDAESRFEVLDGDAVIGMAEYLEMPGDDQRVFFHTEVDEAYKGQGLAVRLAELALESTVAEGRRVVPVCAFIAAYVRKHPEYAPQVDEPTGRHRSAVRAAGSDA